MPLHYVRFSLAPLATNPDLRKLLKKITKAHQLFGDQLPKLLDELATVLAA